MRVRVGGRQYNRGLIVFFFAGVLLWCVLPLLRTSGVAQAAATSSSGVLRVSPALSNFSLSSGETSTTAVVTVTNLTATRLSLAVSTRDFGSQTNRPGAIDLYGDNYDPSTNPHSLQAAMDVDKPSLTLNAYQSEKVSVVLHDLNQLAPGGHYGAVLFSPQGTTTPGGHPKVSLQSAIASLIFLKTADGGTQQLQLRPLNLGAVLFGLPSTVYADFNNTGNTQTDPQGQLTLFGPTGAIVSTTVLNVGSGLVLPDSSRLFTIGISNPNIFRALPGRYRLQLSYRASNSASLTTVSQTFYFINLAIILPVLLLVFTLMWLLKNSYKRIRHLVGRFVRWLYAKVHKTKNVPPPPKPKKRPPPLIQG